MPDHQQEKPLNELLSRSMVDIYVGTENTHWILHEKLLCYHSPFFRNIFLKKGSTTKTYGLPDEEDAPFKTFVGWLYSSSLPVPREESDLGNLFDVYLMSEKFGINTLIQDILQVVREWYKYSDSYPGLRRVQYIYANTEADSPMRHMLVHSVARLMVLENSIPQHWDKALRKNGQLAVDIIKAIQDWRLGDDVVPDARDDPAEAEDLVEDAGEEIDEGVVGDADGEDEVEVDGEDEEEAEEEEQDTTDNDDTIVASPTEAKMPSKDFGGMKGKANGLVTGMGKLGLQAIPNGITNGDYGTLH